MVNPSLASHVRDRQRQVAEREASRLARPDERKGARRLGHADRSKSAVTTTPSGLYARSDNKASTTEWCGPFSVARQLIAKREEAKRQQELEDADDDCNTANHPLDAVMDEIEMKKKRKLHPSINWKAQQDDEKKQATSSMYAKRLKRARVMAQKNRVPSLFELCIRFLVDNFEYVESLGDVDTDIRTSVTHELVARGKMDESALTVLTSDPIPALDIIDCASLSQELMCERLNALLPQGLSYLQLEQCGRCFGPKLVETLVQAATTPANGAKLEALSVAGAYLLKDTDAAKLVDTYADSLSSLRFKACPLLQSSLATAFAKTTLLELALEDVPLSAESLKTIVSQKDAWNKLTSLTLKRMNHLTDTLVGEVLEAAGAPLEYLNLSDNHALTDTTLGHIRQYCPHLNALDLSGLRNLTSEGLSAFFTHVVDMSPPPLLSSLNLGKCHPEALSDEVLRLVLESNGVANRQLGLTLLDVQGSTLVGDDTMEQLVKYTKGSLRELNVSFCPGVSDKGLGFLVDNVGRQLELVSIWGNAQLTDTFLDGHTRVHDASLRLEGSWMKRCT